MDFWFFVSNFLSFQISWPNLNHALSSTFYFDNAKIKTTRKFDQNISSAKKWRNMSVHMLSHSNSQSLHESDVSRQTTVTKSLKVLIFLPCIVYLIRIKIPKLKDCKTEVVGHTVVCISLETIGSLWSKMGTFQMNFFAM